ncbi:hypothetical protein GCM10010218_13830 [Streptomyces mashuensis]|uniref:Uncharacterized protein n=1 Tax=Streptomyces mashuensis TaxID=33904 RepID=A0A919EBI4_9ACTN|nr:hypothetical protein [Streptomyces mashuensis]GHF33926.1 hypothetical protein GCM10010218_13830 [Streptomyces mashuensis]
MTLTGKRMLAAGGTVVLAAAVNIATSVLTAKWSPVWMVWTAVLVILAVALQMWLIKSEQPSARRQHFEDVEGRALQQRMGGPGEQVVRRAKVDEDLVQRQD